MRGERLLARGRAAAESRMTDTCAISKAGGRVLNEESGEYEDVAPVAVYTGPCEVKAGDTSPRPIEAAGQALVEQQSTIKLPIVTSTDVKQGQTVEILTSATDPALPGKKFRIAGPFAGTHTTARRFRIEEVS